jgi:hypothetical protein
MGGNISKGIPWSRYSELEIQGILKIHFENLGYNVIWRHKEDPANEGGIDLECHRGDERLILAVKKKPKKEALAQIVELSDENALKRIYVYIGGAAQSFRNKIPNFKNVEFWDESDLEEKLYESHLTLTLKIHNSKTNQAMLTIMQGVFYSIKEKTNVKTPPKTNPLMIQKLWALKDRSVTVHKCSSMAQLMLEDRNRIGKLSDKQICDLMLWLLDYLYVYGFSSLQHFFSDLPDDMKLLINYVYHETQLRSNWFMLLNYSPGLLPGRVDSYLNEYEKEKKEWEKADDLIEKAKERGDTLPDIKWTYLDDVAERFRKLAVWSQGLEGTIDYLFEQSISGDIKYK